MKMKRKDTKSLPVGQIYGIPLDDYIKITSNIFDREWYTNHGQLTSVLEQKVCKYLNVRNAIAVTNATLGLIIALEALGIRNKSIALPSFTFIASLFSIFISFMGSLKVGLVSGTEIYIQL